MTIALKTVSSRAIKIYRAVLILSILLNLEDDVLHADDLDVVDIRPPSLNQAGIFATLDARTYELGQYGR